MADPLPHTISAGEVITLLGLEPHPEGGRFKETWRDGAGTAIYFLLRPGERSHWHRVDRAEIWHHYAGSALALTTSPDARTTTTAVLGPDLRGGERPQVAVPAGIWQSARPLAGWSLVGCTVSPPFHFEGFELAPPDWEPGH